MGLRKGILSIALVLLLAAAAAARNPTPQDKEDYERLIEILFAGSADNKKIAKDALRAMGEVGIKLLKADCKDVTSVRGAFAWSLLKGYLIETDPETLRAFARDELVDIARRWNRTYTEKKTNRDERKRLQQIVSDYVELLIASPKEKDFDELLDALEYSLIKSDDGKTDYGSEYAIWQKLWMHIGVKVRASRDVRELRDWQRTLDAHFRHYSQKKDYVKRRTIQSYHTMTLILLHRINQIKDGLD